MLWTKEEQQGKTAIEIKESGIDKREVLVESTGANQ